MTTRLDSILKQHETDVDVYFGLTKQVKTIFETHGTAKDLVVRWPPTESALHLYYTVKPNGEVVGLDSGFALERAIEILTWLLEEGR